MLPSLLAHGGGGLTGEAVPAPALYAAVVVGSTIGMIGLRARGPVPVGGPAVAPLTVDDSEAGPWPGDAMSRAPRLIGQIVGVLTLVLVLAIGWGGSDLIGLSPLPTAIGSIVWWGVPALALLFGDWWRVVDPFDALAAGIDRVMHRHADDYDATEAADWWVPAALLASLAWTLTCWHDGLKPRTLATWISALTLVMVGGAFVGGRAWVRRSSPFAVLCGTVAAGSPVDWGRGRPRLRSPLRGLAERAGGRRSLAAVIVVLGATAWDVTAGSDVWTDVAIEGSRSADVIWSTLGLAWSILLVGGIWMVVSRLTEALARRAGGDPLAEPLDADLAPALAPLAAVAPLAHQLSAVIYDGQSLWSLASDPFARGWDLFGTASYVTDETLLAPGVQAWIQLALIGLGLALMMVAMWDRLASRVGQAVSTVGWVAAGWTAASGCLVLWLLLDA